MNDDDLAPAHEREAAEIIAAAEAPFDVVGAGTRAVIRRSARAGRRLSTARLTGVVFHAPAEGIARAKAGTALADLEATLAKHDQLLPFEPMDPRVLLGTQGEPTVGGLLATALAGPRGVSAGAVRDNVLGLNFVNGLGEIIAVGGRLTKNVGGRDLIEINCGGHGALGLITEATFKLLPAPRAEATVVIRRLDDARAVRAMGRGLASPYGVSGAATIHAGMGREFPRTLLRVEGFEESVAGRADRLIALLAEFGAKHALTGEDSKRMWRAIRDGAFLAEPRERAVWRASVKPSDAPTALAALAAVARASLMDHGGGLIWIATDPTVEAAIATRAIFACLAGHVELIRADETLRANVDLFAPLAPTFGGLTRDVTAAFDPKRLFISGPMDSDA